MFLVFTLVLLVVALGILASVYSIFFPFMQNLWTVNQYHVAYYGAISAVERAELGLRYRSPWFVWSGWFFGLTWYGPASDYTPELLSGDAQWFVWSVDSRTTTIPHVGMGNTEPMLSDSTSKEYNMLWYTNLETFLLSTDATSDPQLYYSGVKTLAYFSGDSLTGVFRLPPKIHGLFWPGPVPGLLCDSSVGDCDPDEDGTYDDIAVSWSLEWLYGTNGFKIFPTIAVFYYSGMQVDEFKDNALRESLINATGTFAMTHTFTPVNRGAQLTKHTVVGQDADAIETISFSDILSNASITSNNFSGLRLSFGAANLFRTFSNAIYPYLEYQFTFPQAIADRFYTIQGNGRAGEYDVKILLKKPTVQGTVGGDFTVIF